MAICNSVQSIASSECIGDSLVKINNNFANLNADACTLLTLINDLSSIASVQPVGSVVQVRHFSSTAQQTITNTIPLYTIPTTSNGGEITGLVSTIQPKSNSNKILVRVIVTGSPETYIIRQPAAIALFRDSNPTAIASAVYHYNAWGGVRNSSQLTIEYLDDANTTSTITYRVRAGANVSGFYVNGDIEGNNLLGGSVASTVTLTEIKG
jgi:hypothetical protein